MVPALMKEAHKLRRHSRFVAGAEILAAGNYNLEDSPRSSDRAFIAEVQALIKVTTNIFLLEFDAPSKCHEGSSG